MFEFFLKLNLIFLLFITFYIFYSFFYWKCKNFPFLFPKFPFGNITALIFNRKSIGVTMCDIYCRIKKTKQTIAGFYMITKPCIMITDPYLIKLILNKEFNKFSSRDVFYDLKNDPLSGHLFAVNGQKWRQLRHNISGLFTTAKMKRMFPIVHEKCQELVNVIRAGPDSVNIKEILSKFSLDIIASTVFGIEIHDEVFYAKTTHFLNTTMRNHFKMTFGLLYTKFLRYLRVKQIDSDLSNFYINILRETIELRDKQQKKRDDFIDLCTKLIKQKTGDFTFYDMAAQAFIFFIAGYETNSQTIVFCLYELCLNQRIQKQVRNEIRQCLKKNGGYLDYENMISMEYLDCVVKETLRKYPPAPTLHRKCTEPYKIPNTELTIEKGITIWISVLGLHTDPEHYKNPDIFKPERFQKQQPDKNNCTYLPFGSGNRNCIGMKFGLMQVKTALICLINTFNFFIDTNKTKIPIEFANTGILLNTKYDIFLRAKLL